jgi:hypothetical protein
MGHSGLNGLSTRQISALQRYGLLEEVNGDKVKVSPLAMRILFPDNDADRLAAIREAAFKPPLFAEMRAEWGDRTPSDPLLRSYLTRRHFAEDAIDRVIETYRGTLGLLTAGTAAESLADNPDIPDNPETSPSPLAAQRERTMTASIATATASQAAATTTARGGVVPGHPHAGVSRATLPLSEGIVSLEMPDRLSPESLEDLKDWMDVMIRRAERVMKRTLQANLSADSED